MRVNIHWAGGDARHTVGGRRWLACVARDLRVLCDAAGSKGCGGRLRTVGDDAPARARTRGAGTGGGKPIGVGR